MAQNHWMCTDCYTHFFTEGIGEEGPDGKIKTRPYPNEACPHCGALDDGFRFDSLEG